MTNALAKPTTAEIRANLFAVSPPKSIKIPAQSFNAGDVVTINLPKAGIGLYVSLTVTGKLSRTDSATVGVVTASPLAPYNLFKNVNLVDFTGITRVNANGWDLYIRQLCQKWNMGSLAEDPAAATPPYSDAAAYRQSTSATYDAFTVPAGAASTTTTADLAFRMEVPISLHKQTTIGTYPFTVPEGNSTLTITTQDFSGTGPNYPVSVNSDVTATLTNGSIYGTYWYIDPPTNTPLPVADFSVIHELLSVTKTDGIATGDDLTFTLATGRKYYALYGTLIDGNSTPNTLDVSEWKFLTNSANPAQDALLSEYMQYVRDTFGRDMPPGVFLWWFANFPWIPSNYGSLQAVLGLGSSFTAGTTAFLRVLRECTYVTGVPSTTAAGG